MIWVTEELKVFRLKKRSMGRFSASFDESKIIEEKIKNLKKEPPSWMVWHDLENHHNFWLLFVCFFVCFLIKVALPVKSAYIQFLLKGTLPKSWPFWSLGLTNFLIRPISVFSILQWKEELRLRATTMLSRSYSTDKGTPEVKIALRFVGHKCVR